MMRDDLALEVLLFVVEDVFLLAYGALVLCPGVSVDGPRVKKGQMLTIVRPDGGRIKVVLGGVALIRPNVRRCSPLEFYEGIGVEDVPVGSEVWGNFDF